MYKEGHWGITLALFAPLTFFLTYYGAFYTLMFTLSAAFFLGRRPDVDMKLQRWTSRLRSFPLLSRVVPQIRHRTITHTVWFAIWWGLIMTIVWYLVALYTPFFTFGEGQMKVFYSLIYGFFVGFYGILSHLAGDVITPSGINPLYPYGDKKYSFNLVYAKNQWANAGFLMLGFIVTIVAFYFGLTL